MDIRKLQRVIVDGLEDVKAQNIVVFNTEHLSALFERVIIASGTSNRQTKSLASSVREAVKKSGYPVPRTEGESNGEWIIVDCGAAVVHVMQPTIRDYYHLEEIWGDKPVNMKLATATARLVKAAEPEPVRKAATKKAAAKKAPAAKAPRAKAPARTPAKAPSKVAAKRTAPTKTTVARKTPAKKMAAPAGRVVTRVVGVKSAAAKKAAPVARKPAAEKLPARPVAAKRAPARKTSTRG
jgi:ribosome-associated protein